MAKALEKVVIEDEEALRYILKNKAGTVADFEEMFGSAVLEKFQYLGYIKRGIRKDYSPCWGAIKENAAFMLSLSKKPSFWQRIDGYISYYLGL